MLNCTMIEVKLPASNEQTKSSKLKLEEEHKAP